MFTGIISHRGTLKSTRTLSAGKELSIDSDNDFIQNVHAGDSIAINGVCLTVTEIRSTLFTVFASSETCLKSTICHLNSNCQVNMEKALPANGRFNGHFVQGHIDCTGSILACEKQDMVMKLTISYPIEYSMYMVNKGSVAVDGVSVTCTEVIKDTFSVYLIPETQKRTVFQFSRIGDSVNLEFDILAKYIYAQKNTTLQSSLSVEKLKKWGY